MASITDQALEELNTPGRVVEVDKKTAEELGAFEEDAFLSNAAVLQLFGTNDQESARMVSELLGQSTVSFQTMGRALDAQGSGITLNRQQTGRPLLMPDEVRTCGDLHESRSVLFVQGKRPVLVGKLRYFADPEFAGLFEAI